MIIGDFNAHHSIWSIPGTPANIAGNSLVTLLNKDPTICLITPPQFVTYVSPANGKESVLDLGFATANITSEVSVSLGPNLGSDHYPVVYDLNVGPFTQQVKFRKKYKTENVDWSLWKAQLPEVEYSETDSLNRMNTYIINKMRSSKYCIPETTGVYTPYFSKPWWTDKCKQLTDARNKAKNKFRKHPTDQNLQQLRVAENVAKDEVQKAKDDSWKKYTTSINSFSTTGAVWKKVRQFKNNFKPKITPIKDGDIFITDKNEKVKIFAKHFKKSFSATIENDNYNDMTMEVQAAIIDENIHEYNAPFTKHEFYQAIQKLQNTAAGEDRIENIILKNLTINYQEYLLKLFNRSWREEILPTDWKSGLLQPILKPEKKDFLVNSYRPITMLSCVGKLMERMVKTRLDWVVEKNTLLNPVQSGFRKGRSTFDQLTVVENDIRKAYDMNQHTIACFLDLDGAFDAVNHVAVLYKLTKMNIKGRMLGWIQNYLSDRKFKVIFEGMISDELDIKSGVPQGGILSPLLFNVLLHDVPINDHIKISLFADDLVVYSTGYNFTEVENYMQIYLANFEKWCKCWGQKLNPGKCKAMYFSKSMTPNQEIKIQNNNLKYLKSHKFLGLHFDSPHLSWASHINYLKQKTLTGINLLKVISHQHWGSDRETLLMLYSSVVRSQLDYG